MKRFIDAHPLETVTAVVGVVVAALGIALSRQASWVGLTGTILSIVGSSLAAVVSAAIFGAERASESMIRRLAVLRNNLATSSSQISGALTAHLTRGESIETTLARVDQGVGSISSLLRDIGDLIGSDGLPIDTDAIVKSKMDVVGLGEALDTLKNQVAVSVQLAPGPARQPAELLEAIEHMQGQVSEALASLSRAEASTPERRLLEEHASCPYCGSGNSFRLGSLIGDSAVPTCASCGERFHAHRGQVGVFTNAMAGATVGSILSRRNMRLPDARTRQQYLTEIERAVDEGRLNTGFDVTNVIDIGLHQQLPSNVRTPLFFALVNHDYGLITLESAPDKQLRDRRVLATGHGGTTFKDTAEAAWLAQAIFRLSGQPITDGEMARYFFGHEEITARESAVLSQAREFANKAIAARSSGGLDDDRETAAEAAALIKNGAGVTETEPDT